MRWCLSGVFIFKRNPFENETIFIMRHFHTMSSLLFLNPSAPSSSFCCLPYKLTIYKLFKSEFRFGFINWIDQWWGRLILALHCMMTMHRWQSFSHSEGNRNPILGLQKGFGIKWNDRYRILNTWENAYFLQIMEGKVSDFTCVNMTRRTQSKVPFTIFEEISPILAGFKGIIIVLLVNNPSSCSWLLGSIW